MYEELIEALRLCVKYDNAMDALMNAEKAADAIEELICEVATEHNERLDAEERHRWIPVTERLPDCFYGEEIGNVEWISHGTVYAGCFGRGGKFRDAYFRVWNDDTEGIDAINAEYWRFALLPEPPKEET